jgi:hypothetical protein
MDQWPTDYESVVNNLLKKTPGFRGFLARIPSKKNLTVV